MLRITSHLLQVHPEHYNLPKDVPQYAMKIDMHIEDSALRDNNVHWLAVVLIQCRKEMQGVPKLAES